MSTMKQSAYDRAKDAKVAEEVGKDWRLMCTAKGCPNVWTVDSNDKGINRLCSAHAWRDARKRSEAEITAQQQDLVTDLARQRSAA